MLDYRSSAEVADDRQTENHCQKHASPKAPAQAFRGQGDSGDGSDRGVHRADAGIPFRGGADVDRDGRRAQRGLSHPRSRPQPEKAWFTPRNISLRRVAGSGAWIQPVVLLLRPGPRQNGPIRPVTRGSRTETNAPGGRTVRSLRGRCMEDTEILIPTAVRDLLTGWTGYSDG